MELETLEPIKNLKRTYSGIFQMPLLVLFIIIIIFLFDRFCFYLFFFKDPYIVAFINTTISPCET